MLALERPADAENQLGDGQGQRRVQKLGRMTTQPEGQVAVDFR